MKDASNRCPCSVIDNREDSTDPERACPNRAEGKLGSAIDCYTVGYDFVRPGTVGVEFVNISRVVIQSKTTLDGEGGWLICSIARGQKGLHTGVSSNRHRPGNNPATTKRASIDTDRTGACSGTTEITHEQDPARDSRPASVGIRPAES